MPEDHPPNQHRSAGILPLPGELLPMPDPSSPHSSTPYYATPKQPRLIWNDRDKRKAAEPLPTQTVEIIRPFDNMGE
jgi:hypothetical protein